MFPWQVCVAHTNCSYQHFELMWSIGVLLGSIVFGGLFALGVNCIHLLWRRNTLCSGGGGGGGNVHSSESESLVLEKGVDLPFQNQMLGRYVAMLLMVNTVFVVLNFLWSNVGTVFGNGEKTTEQIVDAFLNLQLACTLMIVFTGILTDGLLVWRCYMTEKTFGYRKKSLSRYLWVFPASCWVVMITVGTAGAITTRKTKNPGHTANVAKICLTTALLCNITINVFSTALISLRLILYRRKLRNILGASLTNEHYRVMEMLLESAVINVPLSIITLVGIVTWRSFGDFVASVIVPAQSFASVLVIYQVAIGKAIGRRRCPLPPVKTNASV